MYIFFFLARKPQFSSGIFKLAMFHDTGAIHDSPMIFGVSHQFHNIPRVSHHPSSNHMIYDDGSMMGEITFI